MICFKCNGNGSKEVSDGQVEKPVQCTECNGTGEVDLLPEDILHALLPEDGPELDVSTVFQMQGIY